MISKYSRGLIKIDYYSFFDIQHFKTINRDTLGLHTMAIYRHRSELIITNSSAPLSDEVG